MVPPNRRLLAVAALAGALVAGCTLRPFELRDLVRSLEEPPERVDLQCTESRPQLVVLQHGMLRSSWSLWRFENALEAHGYEVLNTSYPSTRDSIEQHAAALEQSIETYLSGRPGPLPEFHFIGHSMGGLVIRSYLARGTARPARTALFLGTPQRGSALASASSDSWLFRTFGGTPAKQLVLDHPFYAALPAVDAERIGCLYGSRGDAVGWSETIPGDDDSRVGIDEAQLPEQTDSVALRLAHTALTNADTAIVQVLRFLKHGEFAQRPH